MQLKLLPPPEHAVSLLATMERFNAACDSLAETAFQHQCANKVQLQKLAYHGIRSDFGLSAQMTVRAIAKVVEVYKRDKAIQPTFRPHGAIVYDERILSWKGADRVSVWTLDGRAIMPWVCGAYQAAQLGRARGQADLIYRDGLFFLYVTIDVGDERWPGEFGQVVKWIFCLSAARMPRIRSKNDKAYTPEPQPGLQGESGVGGHQGREDTG